MGDLSAGSVVLAITDNGVAVFYTLSGPEDLNIAEGRSAVLTKRRSTIGTAPGEPDAGPALERTTGAGGRLADKAQQRLCRRFRWLGEQKPRPVATVARSRCDASCWTSPWEP